MRLHLVDGTYELFRAHFSQRPSHSFPDGRDGKATVGLASSMLALLHEEEERVSHVAVAFDHPIRSFRNRLFDGYKTEEGVPEELLGQFSDAEEAVRALGMVVWPMDEFEADDALATAAARWRGSVEQVRILSPDKDFGQCIRGRQVVLVDRRQRRLTDAEALFTLRGLAPESVPDWLALVGDTADGIPGLPGFGEKTAAALLARYVHLERIPLDPRSWEIPVRGAAALAQTLREHWDRVLLYRKLATLVEDVPLAEELEDLRWRGVPREAFQKWCEVAAAQRLLERPQRWAESAAG